MPGRNHLWPLILIFCSCASLLHRENDFDHGLRLYREKQYTKAADYFESYYKQHPDYDSTLYYLFNCYKHLDMYQEQISVLEELASRDISDGNVYLNLVYYYRKYEMYTALYTLLLNSPSPTKGALDKNLALTRGFFAELICGATVHNVQTDAMTYCISRGYLPLFPDGQMYYDDTLSFAHVIILLDRLIAPDYPRHFFPMKRIPTKSYLYLPYMRLVDAGILEFEPYLSPEASASVTTAVGAIAQLVKRGRFD